MKGRKWIAVSGSTLGRRLVIPGLLVAATVVLLALSACTKAEPAQEPTAPTEPIPAPTSVAIGMNVGERYHDIHANKLALKCDFCHTSTTETYYDPLAQVSNLADKRACLSCHKEGGAQPFYGEDWAKANVKQ